MKPINRAIDLFDSNDGHSVGEYIHCLNHLLAFCNQATDSRDSKLKALPELKMWLKVAVTEQICRGKSFYKNTAQSSRVPCRVMPADMAAIKLFPPSSSLIYRDSIVCQYKEDDPNKALLKKEIETWDRQIKVFLVRLAKGLSLETSRQLKTKKNRFSLEDNVSSITLEVNSLDSELQKYQKTAWSIFDEGKNYFHESYTMNSYF